MEKDEIKKFFELYEKLDLIADRIFDKLVDAKLVECTMYAPRYKGINFDLSTDKTLIIYYNDEYDDWEDPYTFSIPVDVIINNKVDEFIKEKTIKLQELERIRKEEEERNKLQKELEEYKRLKLKFEK